MTKSIFTIIAMAFFALNTFAIIVPDAVQKAFQKKFPTAINVKWGKENAIEYEANFKINEINASANFSTDGNWLETETEISAEQLPEAVATAIKKLFPQSTVIGTDKIENAKGETHFEADLKTGGKTKEVLFYADGTFIK